MKRSTIKAILFTVMSASPLCAQSETIFSGIPMRLDQIRLDIPFFIVVLNLVEYYFIRITTNTTRPGGNLIWMS